MSWPAKLARDGPRRRGCHGHPLNTTSSKLRLQHGADVRACSLRFVDFPGALDPVPQDQLFTPKRFSKAPRGRERLQGAEHGDKTSGAIFPEPPRGLGRRRPLEISGSPRKSMKASGELKRPPVPGASGGPRKTHILQNPNPDPRTSLFYFFRSRSSDPLPEQSSPRHLDPRGGKENADHDQD